MSDAALRELERVYLQNPTKENEVRWHIALKRAGMCTIADATPMAKLVELRREIAGMNLHFIVDSPIGEAEHQACPVCKDLVSNIKVWFRRPDISGDLNQATISSVDGGKVSVVDNSIHGAYPDGETVHKVRWDCGLDAITPGARVAIHFGV